MTRRTRPSVRRPVQVVLALALLAVAATAAPIPAPAGAPPVVTTGDVLPSERGSVIDCAGQLQVTPSSTVVRILRSGSTASAVQVGLTLSGSLAGEVVDPPATVDFGAGSDESFVSLPVGGTAAGSVTLTLEQGSGYTLGDPFSTTVDFDAVGEPLIDCGEEIPLRSGSATQTIRVGERPTPLEVELFASSSVVVIGTLPPGLTWDRVEGWQGAATTPGTYRFLLRQCDGPTSPLCAGQTTITITVLPAAAAPAAAVPTTARFTG